MYLFNISSTSSTLLMWLLSCTERWSRHFCYHKLINWIWRKCDSSSMVQPYVQVGQWKIWSKHLIPRFGNLLRSARPLDLTLPEFFFLVFWSHVSIPRSHRFGWEGSGEIIARSFQKILLVVSSYLADMIFTT